MSCCRNLYFLCISYSSDNLVICIFNCCSCDKDIFTRFFTCSSYACLSVFFYYGFDAFMFISTDFTCQVCGSRCVIFSPCESTCIFVLAWLKFNFLSCCVRAIFCFARYSGRCSACCSVNYCSTISAGAFITCNLRLFSNRFIEFNRDAFITDKAIKNRLLFRAYR